MAAATDAGFGPKLLKLFDFTLTFEHAILGILPTTLLIATFPVLLFYYSQLPDVILPGSLLWAKLVRVIRTTNSRQKRLTYSHRSVPLLSLVLSLRLLCFVVPSALYRHYYQAFRPDEKSAVVLDNVTVTIPASQKVGIVGRTGCGKSSVIMTLLKFTEFIGNIFIDGKDIHRVSHRELRTRVTTISQGLITLDDTVYPWAVSDSPGKDASPEDVAIVKVLRQLGLWDFIQVKGGLAAKVSDMELSHVQLQLLCIARGLLHKVSFRGKLVLVDEPMSGLDVNTQKLVQQVFRESFADCTIIMVAHRVETLEDANITLHKDNGKLVARTEPTQLTAASAG